jgi:hypothetical protein
VDFRDFLILRETKAESEPETAAGPDFAAGPDLSTLLLSSLLCTMRT